MAQRPKGFGMTAELARKKDAKYDAGLAKEAVQWIEACTGQSLPTDGSSGSVHDLLKDGTVLCKLANSKGASIKINESKMAFKQMENISNFLSYCEKLGVNKVDLFQTVDLYESQNMPQVIGGIHALGRKCQGMGGPSLGPKEATANKREFTEEQLRQGEGIIGLQAGSNKGASQAGQNFGKTRAIID